MLTRLFHLAINTTDVDRSLAFYEKLGFNVLADRRVQNDMVKKAFGVPSGDMRFVHLRLGDSEEATLLDIVEWYNPSTAEGFERPQQHQRGITRFAVLTDDTQKVYDELTADGVEFLTEPTTVMTPEGGWTVALLLDPDDVVVQVTQLMPAPDGGA